MILCRIPGQLNDRRTLLGELNWIFTAITDTIAWNTLPRGESKECENIREAVSGLLHHGFRFGD